MLAKEENYDFKKELLAVHKPHIRDFSLKAKKSELDLSQGVSIFVETDGSDVVKTAVKDFCDYLYVSQSISVSVLTTGKGNIHVRFSDALTVGKGYMGYRISTTRDGVLIEGHDDRGIAQAFYYLEDLMNIRKAPFLSYGVVERKALFSPRISQSPFGMYEWCDEAFQILAHHGMDAIDLWLKNPFTDNRGQYIDIRLIAERAQKYGIDVYVQLYAPHSVHPSEENAQEFYDELYGALFKVCPLIKGVTLVGEANNFASKDPNVGLSPYVKNYVDNIPTGKISPGWYPCCDYPAWVDMIKNAVRKQRADADVVFCTYNWGYQPEEARVKLIENLPTDISLLVTWDMFHKFKLGDTVEDVCDYSLCFEGPGEYFMGEAVVAKKRGIKLYAITNTSGRTWDFGTVPYEPMPQQWIRRYKNIQKAHEAYALAGILENIHYGFHPSLVSALEKQAFFTPVETLEQTLRKLIVKDYGEQTATDVEKAMNFFSKAIREYVPTNEDQYGAFRIGPAYPFWTEPLNGLPASIPEQGKRPNPPHAMFGNAIYFGCYTPDNQGRISITGTRIYEEMKAVRKVEQLLQKGIDVLESISVRNDNLERLILLTKFMRNHCRTAYYLKKHYVLQQQLNVAKTREKANGVLREIEEILLAEKQNVLDTIPIVQMDSRLGWEASMGYTTDEKGLKWKLRQLDYELDFILPNYRKSNAIRLR